MMLSHAGPGTTEQQSLEHKNEAELFELEREI